MDPKKSDITLSTVLTTLFFTVLTLIFYIIFLYLPTVELENDFNEIVSNTNGVLINAEEVEQEIEDTNTLVNSGINSFCDFYNESVFGPIYFGDAFIDLCAPPIEET